MLESVIQAYFIGQVKERGLGIAVKVDCGSMRGWPDVTYIDDIGRAHLIEFKKAGGRISPQQKDLHDKLFKLGREVHIIDSKELADDFLEWVTDRCQP